MKGSLVKEKIGVPNLSKPGNTSLVFLGLVGIHTLEKLKVFFKVEKILKESKVESAMKLFNLSLGCILKKSFKTGIRNLASEISLLKSGLSDFLKTISGLFLEIFLASFVRNKGSNMGKFGDINA